MRISRPLLLLLAAALLTGCVLTKIVTTPMRIVGAVISIVPLAGNVAHDAIDEAADLIDRVPI